MAKMSLTSRKRISEALRMVLRAEALEEDAEAAADCVALLEQWESGTIHGRAPEIHAHTKDGLPTGTVYG